MKKVMLVTGGTRGIGAAVVRQALNLGYRVCATYQKNLAQAQALQETMKQQGYDLDVRQLDVRYRHEVAEVFRQVHSELGSVDVVVNCAGIVDKAEPFLNYSEDRIKRIFKTNVFGTIYSAQEAVRFMAASKGGKGGVIINISSVAARLGAPYEYIDYAASKGAIDSLTIGLAKELAEEKIRVNAVRPGIIDTDIHADSGDRLRPQKLSSEIPLKRPGNPEEVASSVLWLASDQAAYVTGSILDVTGGR